MLIPLKNNSLRLVVRAGLATIIVNFNIYIQFILICFCLRSKTFFISNLQQLNSSEVHYYSIQFTLA